MIEIRPDQYMHRGDMFSFTMRIVINDKEYGYRGQYLWDHLTSVSDDCFDIVKRELKKVLDGAKPV
jgi:hypothetical protein